MLLLRFIFGHKDIAHVALKTAWSSGTNMYVVVTTNSSCPNSLTNATKTEKQIRLNAVPSKGK